jgi:hypothetical protein
MRNPGRSKPVVVALCGMSVIWEWMMEDMSHRGPEEVSWRARAKTATA